MQIHKRLFSLFLILLSTGIVRASSGQMTTRGIAAGASHALALRSDGTVWAWGTNQLGELGISNLTESVFPARVTGLSNIVNIAAGSTNSLAVQTNGTVWAWGNNIGGQLGNGTSTNSPVPAQVTRITNAIAVSGGVSHSLALLANGQVMSWGTNANLQLGNGTSTSTNQPVFVSNLTNAIKVVAGGYHSVALTAAGEVWCWGKGGEGEIGNGQNNSQSVPVKALNLSNIVDVAAGSYHTLALKADGTVWAWGYNGEGELGLGNTNNTNVPTLISALGPVQTIGAGFISSMATLTNGQTVVWGYQNGTYTLPTPLSPSPAFTKMVSGFYGYGFSLGMTSDGAVWGWGANDRAQLGNGNKTVPPQASFVFVPTMSFAATPSGRWGQFTRGNIAGLNFCSMVVPVDLEQGVSVNRTGSDAYGHGSGTPWFVQIQNTAVYHAESLVSGTTNLTRFRVENPMVAFGSQGKGSPLYVNQPYSLGLYAGGFDENSAGSTNVVKISVYDRTLFNGSTNIAPLNAFNITLPRRTVSADSNSWTAFMANGGTTTVETNGLRTTVQFMDTGDPNNKPFGLTWMTNANGSLAVVTNFILTAYKLTHTATTTNYFYKVEVLGKVQVGTNALAPMGTNSAGAWTGLLLYTLDFERQPFLRSIYVDNLYFQGTPMPPTYAGKSLRELNGLSMAVTNAVTLTNNSAYTNLDASPELRRHPLLDQFVADMKKDPLALASYVINEIDLTDPYAVAESNQVVKASINCGGVNRSALSTFLEGQGSPIEHCALLVYLLRQAGYSAAYVFPTNGNLSMLDTRISQLWRVQVKGVVNVKGVPYLTNSLITVNYPWVAANIGTNTVHIFPWLKDTEIVDGVDLYDYMPTNYNTALKWCEDYVRGKTNILNLDSENLPAKLFPKFVQQMLSTNSQGAVLSLDDVGVRAFNRRHQYPAWSYLPQPNFATNTSTAAIVGSLTDSTNTFPFLANIFDIVRVEIYNSSVASTNLLLTTGDWDACDWHDRKFLIFTNNARLNLWLAPYTTNVTAVQAFAGPSSTATQTNSVALGAGTNLIVQAIHQRRVARLSQPTAVFPTIETKSVTNRSSCVSGDVAAICMDFGRVTAAMLQPYADAYWALQRQRATNNTFVPPVQDYQGTAAYLLGMGYFQKLDAFNAQNQQFHKVQALVNFQTGLGVIGAVASATNMQAKVDMTVNGEVILGNGSLRPDSRTPSFSALENYYTLAIVAGSAQEHNVIQRMFKDQDAISTVRLLQLAQARATNGNSPILEFFSNNYAVAGNQAYTGYGTNKLKDQDPSVWSAVSNIFNQAGSDYARVLITPGMVTNQSKSYIGMGALIISETQLGALISGNKAPLNGGWGSILPGYTPLTSSAYFPFNLFPASDGGFFFGFNNPSGPTVQTVFSDQDALFLNVNPPTFSPFGILSGSDAAFTLNLSGASTASATRSTADTGLFGRAAAWMENAGATVFDPVSVVSGDFYVDAVDLTLPGPFPLELRRNYLSRNLDANQFGYGWKQNFMPYLVLTTNAASQSIILAAESDGAVIAYHLTNGYWKVLPEDNPSLNNNSTAGAGATANKFNARLDLYTTNGNTYVITGTDGSQRFYQQMNSFGLSSGTNHLDRNRPYLTRWQDHAGNYHLFSYGTNALANDYGQLTRIDSANGNSLLFKYDFFGRIIQAFTADGRFVQYDYDDYGDLITVTLPDFSQCQYQYDHYAFTSTNNGVVSTNIDSNHLMLREIKPNGRIVANLYDSLRRVMTQASTVGTNLVLVTNAFFFYTNNVTSLTNQFASGVTRVEDVFHNPTSYYYTNNLITNTVDAFGYSVKQTWFPDVATNLTGYYPRSLQRTVDRRSLTNDFYYDISGNATQAVVRGDITGEGILTQTATNSYTYTAKNLPNTTKDPSGNAVQFNYDGTDPFLLATLIQLNGTTPIATNAFYYTNVATLSSSGTTTNFAFGLLWRTVRPGGATNELAFDGRGFMTRQIRYPATAEAPTISDPRITNYFSYNARGQLYQQQTAGGGTTQADYDPMGRIKSKEAFDQYGQSLSREFFYYNRNGELEWYDGPRSNPEDYVYYRYDGAGRAIQQIRWRSQGKADGSGVEAPAGYNLYSTVFQEYDGFGNLKRAIDARGVVTTNTWDALGRLMKQTVLETNAVQMKSEGFAYEPGGLVTYATNALGGVTQTLYNSLGKPRFRRGPDGSTNRWTYYLDGRPRREYQGNGAYWETTYDDVNRRVIRIYSSAAGSALATNSTVLDRRGNVMQRLDAAANSFTNLFDGLDRIKIAAGPAVISTPPTNAPNPGGSSSTTNQQVATSYYDSAGLAFTNANALGEKTITYLDGLGRVTRSEIRDSTNTLVRQSTRAYSADHQSVTVTDGSGATAVVTSAYTDNGGHVVLSILYPSAAIREFTLSQYDLVGNLTSAARVSAASGVQSTWQTANYAYDGLNRMTSKTDRDNALTQLAYDSAGDLTNRTMPGGVLSWRATYNNAGQILQEYNLGSGNAGARTNSYVYYASNNPFAGLLQSRTDGRGVICTHVYDNWLRTLTLSYTNTAGGSPSEQSLTTAFAYDTRGMVTNINENFASTNTGPATSVTRSYDPNGLLISEKIAVGGSAFSSASQYWNSGARRATLNFDDFGYSYGWRADGRLVSATGSTGGGSYAYDTAGQLLSRTLGPRVTSINQRDGAGRPLWVVTTVNAATNLNETLAYTGDGLLSTHWIARPDFTDGRSYTYASLSRRLAQEIVRVNASTLWTNNFIYDAGAAGGLGVLTRAGQSAPTGTAWKGGTDALSRVNAETNSVARRSAYGRLNGIATVSALLDDQPMPVTVVATTNQVWTNQWRTTLEMTPGPHQLVATALHPSGLFTTNATVNYTNNAADTMQDVYSADGALTLRVWKKSDGTTNRTQTLSWDAKGRLFKVTERDDLNSGYNWQAVYDGLGRRLRTTAIIVTNAVAITSQPNTISQYYDPQVEFLELGVTVAGKTTWKICGPDLNGVYGGLNGTGGFDAIASGPDLFWPTLSDARGNLEAVFDVVHSTLTWNASRPTGYGAVPGYAPAPLGFGGDIVQASAWRGRWMDITGRINLGARPYRPETGSFESYDPTWNGSDPNGYSFAGGEPILGFDPDGRFGKGAVSAGGDLVSGAGHLLYNTGGTIGYGLMAIFSPETAEDIYGGERQQLSGAVRGTGQLLYDTGGTIGLGLTGDIDSYGDQFNRFGNVADALTGGGEGNSEAYRVGYTGTQIAALFVGGEALNAGRAGEATILAERVGVAADTGASSAIQARNLARQLTSEEQTAQALAGKGEPIFGAGTSRPLTDANRLAQQYGGNPADWAKMGGENSAVHGVTTPAGSNFEMHWYQNVKTGQIVELKTKVAGH